MKNNLLKFKKLLIKRPLILASVCVITLIVFVFAAYVTYANPRTSVDSSNKPSTAKKVTEKIVPEQKTVEKPDESTSVSEQAAAQTTTKSSDQKATSSTPNQTVPTGLKRVPTKQEEDAMHACMQRDSAAYAKYYTNFSAEAQRHKTAIDTIKANYNGYTQYEGIFYSGTKAADLYNADMEEEDDRYQQTTAAISATYNAERNPPGTTC